MSPLARFLRLGRSLALVAACLASPLSNAQAQTIADYSRMQRESIDKALAPPAAPGSREALPPVSKPPSSPGMALRSPAPSVIVNGVFASASRAVAEVVVGGRVHVLAAGERVPGTRWQVDAVAVDRVVLVRIDEAGSHGARRPAVMTIALAPVPGGRP